MEHTAARWRIPVLIAVVVAVALAAVWSLRGSPSPTGASSAATPLLRLQSFGAAPMAAAGAPARDEAPATKAELTGLLDHLVRELDAVDFFRAEERRASLIRAIAVMLERRRWSEAAALELPDNVRGLAPLDQFKWGQAHVHFARAVGAARSGDVARALLEAKKAPSDPEGAAAIAEAAGFTVELTGGSLDVIV